MLAGKIWMEQEKLTTCWQECQHKTLRKRGFATSYKAKPVLPSDSAITLLGFTYVSVPIKTQTQKFMGALFIIA